MTGQRVMIVAAPPPAPTAKALADAALRISKARAALVLSAPFFASLALRLTPRPVSNGHTQTMSTDGRSIYYEPNWVNQKTHDELVGVVAHEAMHCGFLHPFRRQHRDHGKFNRACDFAINLILKAAGFHLPKEGLMDPQYADMTAEAIYTRLPDEPPSPNGCYGGMGSVEDAPNEDGTGPASEAEMQQLAAEWQVAVLQAAQAAKAQGHLPGGLEGLAESIRAPKVDWRAALREFVRAHAKGDWSYRRPNTRHLATGDYFPSLYDETVGPLVLGVDTSGSVSQAELDAVCAELNGVLDQAKPESVSVIYCDSQSYEGETFGPDDWPVKMAVKGRGGTCLRPVWQFVKDKALRPCAGILTTDMELSVSDLGDDPGFPVLILTTGRMAPMDGAVAFGAVIKLEIDA